ncbi:phosphatase 2C-like domain-containing protein [Sparassis latifolia]|uniref:protein-serine/threonine phosphatase n=1 Tax=Sparassis crispa TaxID=139825 RepID=A0A401H589_9APHY|nr:Protein phosphatase 2C homolog 2 [Sparassis crispa]GBE89606.1 Protein phosphatase 2C homolog 2 [Sparassis crispa]
MSRNAVTDSCFPVADSGKATVDSDEDMEDLNEDMEDSDEDMMDVDEVSRDPDEETKDDKQLKRWRSIWLMTPNSEKLTIHGKNSRFCYAVTSMQGWRRTMEDKHAVQLHLGNNSRGSAFFAVFDGHGGNAVAEFARAFLHQTLCEDEEYARRAYPKALRNAFLKVDAKLSGVYGDMAVGSTANVALVTGKGRIYLANAGDSRAVLSNKGKAKTLSTDHKTSIPVEKARVEAADGYVWRGRVNNDLAMTRALGDFRYKQNMNLPPEKQIVTADPEVMEHEITEEDEFLILACDGIWDCLESQQVVDLVRLFVSQGKMLSKVCEDICQYCLAPHPIMGRGSDNMTLMVVALLHGRTPREWSEWVTERTVSRYGYDTPEMPPEIYSPAEVERMRPIFERVWHEIPAYEAKVRASQSQTEDDAASVLKIRIKIPGVNTLEPKSNDFKTRVQVHTIL